MLFTPLLIWLRTNPRNVWLILGLLTALALATGLYLKGRHDAHARDQAARAVAIAQAKAINDGALGKAAAERSSDAGAVVALQEKLTDAYADTSDSAPSGARLALSCERVCLSAQARLPEFSRIC